MKLEYMREIVDTYDFLVETICGKGLSYEQTKEELKKADPFISILNDQEELYDAQIGLTVFTIYKDGKKDFHIYEFAQYFLPTNTAGEPIIVEL